MRYSTGKRNRPDVITLSGYDDAKYGNWIRDVVNRRTASRKHFKEDLKFYGGSFIIRKTLVPITALENHNDGILLLAKLSDPKVVDDSIKYFSLADMRTLPGFSARFHKMVLVKSIEKNYGMISRATIPPNARLLSIDPPMWVQFCPGAVLYTPGVLWCREPLKEYEDDVFTFENLGDRWLIRVSAGVYSLPVREGISGVYYMDDGRLWRAGERPNADDVFLGNIIKIRKKGDEYVAYNRTRDREFLRVKKHLVDELGKVSTDEKTVYVPKLYLERGVRKLVG